MTRRQSAGRRRASPGAARGATRAPGTVTRAELADLLGKHPMTVTKWERDGMPIATRGRRGVASRYREADVRAWLEQRERAAADGRLVDVAAQRARKELAQAMESEQRFQLRARTLLPAEDVDRLWSGEVTAVRTRLLAVPATSADALYSAAVKHGVAGVERALETLVRDILTELSDPDRPVDLGAPANGNGHTKGAT